MDREFAELRSKIYLNYRII